MICDAKIERYAQNLIRISNTLVLSMKKETFYLASSLPIPTKSFFPTDTKYDTNFSYSLNLEQS